MTDSLTDLPARPSLLDIVERASLFALLQQAMQRQHTPQELPVRLYDDLGIFRGQWPQSGRNGSSRDY